MRFFIPRNCIPAFCCVLACCELMSGAEEGRFVVEKLTIHGRDATVEQGLFDIELPVASPQPSTEIELSFQLPNGVRAELSALQIKCAANGGPQGLIIPPTTPWNADCSFDQKTGRGVFRIKAFPLVTRAYYRFSVDVTRVWPGAPAASPYSFVLTTYPYGPRVGMATSPFYVTDESLRDDFLFWHTPVHQSMNRDVPPNTSIYFTITTARKVEGGAGGLPDPLKIYLIKLDAGSSRDAFLPVRVPADLPRGEERLVFDGSSGGEQNGFSVSLNSIVERSAFFPLTEYAIWIKRPDPSRPAGENADFLEPGKYYSVQYELAQTSTPALRYEVARFGVRPRREGSPVAVVADFEADNFVDWQGDFYNGHLLPTHNVPDPIWGDDYLSQKRARDMFPDLWRTAHYQYVNHHFSDRYNVHPNLFRDSSQRLVTKADTAPSGRILLTLSHFAGAKWFVDPDDPSDTIASRPIVGEADKAVFEIGDKVYLQTGDPQASIQFFNRGKLLEATVEEVRSATNQVVLKTDVALWSIEPEGEVKPYPAVLGEAGAPSSTIELAADFKGTYLRLQNGRPYVNFGVLNWSFDFLVATMKYRVSIERYAPHRFVGDAVSGRPSRRGWQIVSDCEYYVMRHLLHRYRAELDTFLHPVFGESTGWEEGGDRFVALYDFYADGILRAYEEVLKVSGQDYEKIQIGLGGIHLAWNKDNIIRLILAHAAPAPFETVFPESCPDQAKPDSLPTYPLGSNPLYFFTPQERDTFRQNHWETNACFFDETGKPRIGDGDWDANGRLADAAVSRLRTDWRNSAWLLSHTRFGKGTPFRSVSVEGYGYPAEQLAKCVIFEKELLRSLSHNLKTSSDLHVQRFLENVSCGTVQLALFGWDMNGDVPLRRPFQGSGYWPTYFADVMRRVVSNAAQTPDKSSNVGTFLFDTFIAPDVDNVGTDADTAAFRIAGKESVKRRDLGNGKSLETRSDLVTLDKDIRNFIRMIGMMTHRLAAIPEQKVAGHVISGVVSKHWDNPPAEMETGNGSGDEKRFFVLLYDHCPADLESQDRMEIPLKLDVRRLPRQLESARITIYRLDKEHGSLYAATRRMAGADKDLKNRVLSSSEITALKQASQLALDKSFNQNGSQVRARKGNIELDLTLAANSVLFVVVDWNGDATP